MFGLVQELILERVKRQLFRKVIYNVRCGINHSEGRFKFFLRQYERVERGEVDGPQYNEDIRRS